MPITYHNFCALATLLFYIIDRSFLITNRYELALLWNKPRCTKAEWETKNTQKNNSSFIPVLGRQTKVYVGSIEVMGKLKKHTTTYGQS